MDESKITTRYAKAIFELAKDKKILDKIKSDFDLIKQVIAIKEFKQVLISPIVPTSQKKSVLLEIFKNKIQEYSLDFLLIVVENKREPFLEMMINDFNELYKKALGITEVDLTTAIEIDSNIKQEFINFLNKNLKTKIDLHHKVDSSILGGFILRIENKLLDLSVSSRLKLIKKELTK